MIVTIYVTYTHIASGLKQDCRKCPIALAIHEVLKDGYTAHIDFDNTGVYTLYDQATPLAEYYLPEIAQNFIKQFDNNERTKPFSFKLNISEEFVKQGSNQSMNTYSEAPKLEWQKDGAHRIAGIGGYEVGSYSYAECGDVWLMSFLEDTHHCQTEPEAIEWVETQWREFWTKIHEVEA